MSDTTPVSTPVAPTFDPELIKKEAETIADQKIESLKENLVKSLGGGDKSRYGKSGPESWDKLHDDIVGDAVPKAVKEAEERITAKFEAEKKSNEEKIKAEQTKSEEEKKREWDQITIEWKDAVKDGVMPDISADVKKELEAGKLYTQLTEEQQKDPGLVAYQEAVALHAQLKKEGKSTSFYRTVSRELNKKPAGARAPVIGSSVSMPSSQDELTYDEVKANRKSRYGY